MVPLLIAPLSIIMIIIYLKTQKIYTLALSVSSLTYIIAILFTIEKFNPNTNTIFLLLTFSAILMILIGLYLNYSRKNVERKIKE